MPTRKQYILTALLITAFCVEYFFHAAISNIIEKEIRKEVAKNKIPVSFESADYGYFPPRATIEGLHYSDEQILLTSKEISLSIQVLPLIKGLLRPNVLSLEEANFSYKLPKKPIDSKKPTFEISLSNILKQIPIEELKVLNSKAILLDDKTVVNLNIDHLSLAKLYNKLQFETKSVVQYRDSNIKESVHLNTKARWQESGFFINFLSLQKENSIAQISGSINKEILDGFKLNTENLYKNITELRLKLNLDLTEVSPTLEYFTKTHAPPRSPIKTYSGRLQMSGYYYNSKLQEEADKSIFNVKLDNISSPFISLYQLETKGELTKSAFSFKSVRVAASDKSSIILNDFKVQKKQGAHFVSAKLKSEKIHVEDILKSLNIPASNIYAPVALDVGCGGLVSPKNVLLKCDGSGDLFRLDVKNLSAKNNIISVNKVSTKFKSSITKTDFNFSADAMYQDPVSKLVTNGTVDGNVNFVSGFDVNFKTEPINLSFLNEVSGQKFNGLTALDGNSKGSSKWGEITTTLLNQNFQFNDLFIGNAITDMTYKFPFLRFDNIEGEVLEGSNKYKGAVSLNVDKNLLFIDIKGQQASDHGIRTVFADMFSLPENINFDADYSITLKNSLDINKMDMDLETDLRNLNIFDERFPKGKVHLKGPQGKWAIKQALLQKEKSSFSATGHLKGFKELSAEVESQNFNLSESDFLKKLNLKFTGPAQISLVAKGPLTGPKATGHISLQNTRGPKKNNLGNSELDYRIFEDSFFVKGDAFNRSVQGEGYYPLNGNGSLSYTGTIKKLDLLNFISLNSQNIVGTKLLAWSEPDFTVKNVSSSSPKGSVKNTRLELVSNDQSLLFIKQEASEKLSKPLKFKALQAGRSAELHMDFSKRNKTSIFLNGKLSLGFLKPFIPTCEFIKGDFSSKDLIINSSTDKFTTSGLAAIRNGSFKSDSFPYSFNQISTDIRLSKNKLDFSKINASLANTFLNGNGIISLEPQNSNINFNFKYNDLNIEFPAKIASKTSGTVNLSGNKIPLKLSGNIVVSEGLFSQDILSTSQSERVTPNKRLPRQILKSATPPASLDVKVYIKDKMQIETNEASGFASGVLRASANPADPILNGNIKLKQGLKINFHDKEFILKEGLLSYKNSISSNPDVFIDATSEILDNNDPLQKTYALRMLVKGPASDITITFSSQPALEENQIISLLTLGTVSTQSLGQEITATEQATYSGLQFGSYLLQKNQALKELQKQTGTQIGISSSVNTGGVSPKLTVKKSWNPRASSTLSQTFGNQQNLALSNQYNLNKKTSTFLDIQNNQIDESSQLINRRVQQGVILDLGIKYKFEFD